MARSFKVPADDYDAWYASHPEIFESELRAIDSLGLKGLGLDVGAGTGAITAAVGAQVALDPSLTMLRGSKVRGLDAIRGLAERLPFADGVFDFVLMVTSLCFLVSPQDSLLEAKRVLKDHGMVAVCIIPRESPWGKLYAEKARKGHEIYAMARFYSVNEVKALLRECGFRPDKMCSVLEYAPGDAPRIETPRIGRGSGGFVCIRAFKSRRSPISNSPAAKG